MCARTKATIKAVAESTTQLATTSETRMVVFLFLDWGIFAMRKGVLGQLTMCVHFKQPFPVPAPVPKLAAEWLISGTSVFMFICWTQKLMPSSPPVEHGSLRDFDCPITRRRLFRWLW